MNQELPHWLSRLVIVPTGDWTPADWRRAALLLGEYWTELPAGWSPAGMGLLVSGSIIGNVERKVISHGARSGRPPTISREMTIRMLEIVEGTRLQIADRRGVPVGKVTYKEAVEEIAFSAPSLSGLRQDKKRAMARSMENWVKGLKKKKKLG